jgi:molybdenum cofactor guanylyltransferase
MNVSGIVLSGGRGNRAGGADKGLLPWQHSTRIESILQDLQTQVDDIVISANRNLGRYQALGFQVTEDTLPGFQGPLAGIAATLPLCRHPIAIIVPCDSPQLPPDLATRLLAALEDEEIDLSYANDGSRDQYLFMAVRKRCLPGLLECLQDEERAVRGWHRRLHTQCVDFSDQPERFKNLNDASSQA